MRVYTVNFRNLSFPNAAFDFMALNPADDQPLTLLEFGLFVPPGVSLAQCEINLRRHAGTITPGSGGTALSAGNAVKFTSSKIAAAGFSGRIGDTTRQSATTDELLTPYAWNNLNGLWVMLPPASRTAVVQGESLVLTAQGGLGATVVVNGYALVGEDP